MYSSDQNCVLSPKMVYFSNVVGTHGKRLLLTLTKCAHIWKHWKQSQSTCFILNSSQSEPQCNTMQEPIYFSLYIILKLHCVAYCTELIQVLIFNQMQMPCNGHICFLLNNVHCCDQHNQFRDHRFSPGTPISISRRFLGLPAKVLQLLEGP